MKLYVKGLLNGTAHMSGTMIISEGELLERLRNGEGIEISVACDDIRERGYCPRGRHTGEIWIKVI